MKLNKQSSALIGQFAYQSTVIELCPIPICNGTFTPPNCRDPEATRYNMVTAELRNREKGEWAICFADCCFSKKTLDFEYEPLPSSRTDDYIADTRFKNSMSAIVFWREHYEGYLNMILEKNNNLPLAEWVPTAERYENGTIKWALKRYNEGHKSIYFEETE